MSSPERPPQNTFERDAARMHRAIDINEKVAATQSPLVERYRPEMLGEGGEHVVLDLPMPGDTEGKYRGYVAKVSRRMLAGMIALQQERGRAMDDLDAADMVIAERNLQEARGEYQLLREHFGKAVPREFHYLVKVPVTNELLQTLKDEGEAMPELPPGTHEVWTIVRFQKRIPEAAVAAGISSAFQNRYLEKDQIDPGHYVDLNHNLLDGADSLSPLDDLREVSRDTVKLFEHAQTDPELRTTLQLLIRQAITYSEATGNTLDFIGDDNARVYKDNGQWKYLLNDVRTNSGVFTSSREAIAKLVAEGAGVLSKPECNRLMNALNYARFVNAAAAALSMPDRLNLRDGDVAPWSRMILDEMRRHGIINQPVDADQVNKTTAKET